MLQPSILVKRTGETVLCDIDCSLLLGVAEVITGTPSMSALPSGAGHLTFASPAVNPAPITYPDGRTVGTARVIQVLIGGGSIPAGQRSREYVVTASFATNNAGELRQAKCRLLVTDEP